MKPERLAPRLTHGFPAHTDSVDAAASRQVVVPHPQIGATQPAPKGLVRRMSFGSSVSAASSAIAIASPVSRPK